MKQGEYDQPTKINPQRLAEDVKKLLGDKFISISTGVLVKVGFRENTVIVVNGTDAITEENDAAVKSLIETHDPTAKSSGQQHNENVKQAAERLKTVDLEAKRSKGTQAEQIAELFALIADIQLWILGERTD